MSDSAVVGVVAVGLIALNAWPGGAIGLIIGLACIGILLVQL